MSTIRFLMGGGFGRIFANEKQGRIPTNHQALVMPRISVIIPTYNRGFEALVFAIVLATVIVGIQKVLGFGVKERR